jgi:pantothenate kinase
MLLAGECYEDIIDALAQRALSHSSATTSRVIIGVAGSPGSGRQQHNN